MGIADFLVDRIASRRSGEAELSKQELAGAKARLGGTAEVGVSQREMDDAIARGTAPIDAQMERSFAEMRRYDRAQGPRTSGDTLKQMAAIQEGAAKARGDVGLKVAQQSSDVAKQQQLMDREIIAKRKAQIKAMIGQLLPGVGSAFGTLRGGEQAGALAGAGEEKEPEKIGASFAGVGAEIGG